MKFSSNVIEKCIIKSEYFINEYIKETCIKKKNVGELIKDPFGNYVIQTALKNSKGNNKLLLIKTRTINYH